MQTGAKDRGQDTYSGRAPVIVVTPLITINYEEMEKEDR